MNDYIYKLYEPIKVAKNGDFIEVDLITIKAPNMLNLGDFSKLKTIYGKANLSLVAGLSGSNNNNQSSNNEEQVESKMTSKDIISSLTMSGELDIVVNAFYNFILKNGIIGDDIKLTKDILNMLPDTEDFFNIMGGYFENFLQIGS